MSKIKADELSNLAGDKVVPMATVADGSAKAWVNFDGTGTVAIRRSFNVSSITDLGVGLYRLNFASAFIDVDYSHETGGNNNHIITYSPTTTTLTVTSNNNSHAAADASLLCISVFR